MMNFEWVTSPPAESVLRALEGLFAAGMIGDDGRLTVTGEKVAECPVEVNIARMVCSVTWSYRAVADFPQLFSSKEYTCGEEILTIAAMTTVQVSVSVGIPSNICLKFCRTSSSSQKVPPAHLLN